MESIFMSVFVYLVALAITCAVLFGVIRTAILSALAEDRRRVGEASVQ